MFLRSVTPASCSCCPGERDHGDRHFLQVLLAFLRGDDHFRELGGACGRVRRALTLPPGPNAIGQPQYGKIPLKANRF